MNKMYKYGMRLRGFAPMCQPMNGLDHAGDGGIKNGRRYHSFLFYRRRLSESEENDYELDYLGEVNDGEV